MSLTCRIIPCLDVKNGRVTKGTQFVSLIDAGDPVELAKHYNDENADELVFLDITATHEDRNPIYKIIRDVADQIFLPLSVGGGIDSIEKVYKMLMAGADKVTVNSYVIKNPDFINKIARKFGSQCLVVAIDSKRHNHESGGVCHGVYSHGGRQITGHDTLQWASEVYDRGAGEILLTSIDRDGTKDGYDCELIQKVTNKVSIPVIASGGAGKLNHFAEAWHAGASAVLAASLFHFKEISIEQVKCELHKRGIPSRLKAKKLSGQTSF